MNGSARKHDLPRSALVLGCALLWGVVEVLALSRARWARRFKN
ncbi:hypothetical protein ACVNIS_21615 [Sphaerotilaceae bacterium SBD11-9]